MDIGWWMLRDESSELVSNGLVDSFSNCIASCISGSGGNRFDSIDVKHVLKSKSSELSAIAMDASEWSWVPGKAAVFNLHCNMI